jgi:hypothetical protein
VAFNWHNERVSRSSGRRAASSSRRPRASLLDAAVPWITRHSRPARSVGPRRGARQSQAASRRDDDGATATFEFTRPTDRRVGLTAAHDSGFRARRDGVDVSSDVRGLYKLGGISFILSGLSSAVAYSGGVSTRRLRNNRGSRRPKVARFSPASGLSAAGRHPRCLRCRRRLGAGRGSPGRYSTEHRQAPHGGPACEVRFDDLGARLRRAGGWLARRAEPRAYLSHSRFRPAPE